MCNMKKIEIIKKIESFDLITIILYRNEKKFKKK